MGGEKPSDKRRGTDTGVPSLTDEDDGNEPTSTAIQMTRRRVPSAKDRPFLIVLAGGSIGEMYLLTQPEMVVGRARTASIHIDDEGVSRRHAKLIVRGSDVVIEDMNSA